MSVRPLRVLRLCFQLADSCSAQKPSEGSLSHSWLSSERFDVPLEPLQPSSTHGLAGHLQSRTLQSSTLHLQPRSPQLQPCQLHPAHPPQTFRRYSHLTYALHPVQPHRKFPTQPEISNITKSSVGCFRGWIFFFRGERCRNGSH